MLPVVFVILSVCTTSGAAANATTEDACPCQGALPALQALYGATNGDNWIRPWGDMRNISVCTDLSGVSCDAETGRIAVELSARNLTGTIPSSFPLLYPHVLSLSLANNSLTGTLPSTLSLFGSSMMEFVVSNNANLTGTLSQQFSNWTELTYFMASDCKLNGTLPPSYSSMTKLRTFSVTNNGLTGSVPEEYSSWSSIVELFLDSNALGGTFPQRIVQAIASSITNFSISRNRFSGSILTEAICSWHNINTMEVGSNFFVGTLPTCLSEWNRTVVFFNLNNNTFGGTLPSSIQSWSRIQEIDVGYNSLEGTLPAEYSAFVALTTFRVDNNRLSGSLPPQYASWIKMFRFFVSQNLYLSGSIPESYASWGASPFDVRLAQNNFTGTLPETWGAAFINVNMLLFSSNRLSGTLPLSFGGLLSLSVLALDSNNFIGTLPPSWRSLSQVQVISLRNNTGLAGSIPSSWSAMSQLIVLAFCFTNICGNASVFPLLGVIGFACPTTSEVDALLADRQAGVAHFLSYVLLLDRVASVSCADNSSATPPPPTDMPNSTTGGNETASILPFTQVANTAATTAVWSIIATQGLPISTGVPPAASVAFLQGAFAASRLRRRCSAANAANTQVEPPLSDPMDNPTQIELSSSAGEYAGGAVVGNSALLTGAVVLSRLATLLRAWTRQHRSSSSSNSRGCRQAATKWFLKLLPTDVAHNFPGSGMTMYALLATPSIAACVVLLMSENSAAPSYVLAAVGIVIWIVPLVAVARRMHRQPFPFFTKEVLGRSNSPNVRAHRNTTATTESTSSTTIVTIQQEDSPVKSWFSFMCEFWFTPTHVWRVRDQFQPYRSHNVVAAKNDLKTYFSSFGALFAGVRSEWRMLFALELLVAVVCGGVQGAAEEVASSGTAADACDAAEWGPATLAAMTTIVLIHHIVVRPCLVRFDELQTVALTALTVASEIANAIGGDAGQQVGEMIALSAAILQAALAAMEVIASRCLINVSSLYFGSLFSERKKHSQSSENRAAKQLRGSKSLSPPLVHSPAGGGNDLPQPSTEQIVLQDTSHVTLAQIKALKSVLLLVSKERRLKQSDGNP